MGRLRDLGLFAGAFFVVLGFFAAIVCLGQLVVVDEMDRGKPREIPLEFTAGAGCIAVFCLVTGVVLIRRFRPFPESKAGDSTAPTPASSSETSREMAGTPETEGELDLGRLTGVGWFLLLILVLGYLGLITWVFTSDVLSFCGGDLQELIETLVACLLFVLFLACFRLSVRLLESAGIAIHFPRK